MDSKKSKTDDIERNKCPLDSDSDSEFFRQQEVEKIQKGGGRGKRRWGLENEVGEKELV